MSLRFGSSSTTHSRPIWIFARRRARETNPSSGDLFDHPGGTKVGHTAGQCTALSGNAAAGDLLCTQTFLLEGGQITIQGLADRAAVFGRGETVPFAIVGGSGMI